MTNKIHVKQVDFETAHQELLHAMRPYSAASIVEAALRILWMPVPDAIDRLRLAPWQTLLLVKWALEDPAIALYNAPSITQHDFEALRQRLKNIWEWADVDRATGHLFMRQLLYAQINFQREPTFSFMRQAALIGRLPKAHILRQKFGELFGMPPDVYLDLAFSVHTGVLAGKRCLSRSWFSPLEPYYGSTTITGFLGLLAQDLPGLRRALQREHGQKVRPSELYEFPVLKQFPFLLRPDGLYECWHPMVFSRGLEDFVHRRFAASWSSYTEKYSPVFEAYVLELLDESGMRYAGEDELRAIVGAAASVPEAALILDDCNVFIEAKTGLFPESLFVEDTSEHLRKRYKAIRKAIKQGWSISASLRASKPGADRHSRVGQDFLIVVTNRELNLIRGDLFTSMCGESEATQYPSPESQQFLPLSNVHFCSIDDFERLIGMIRAGTIDLVAFLQEVVSANADPRTAGYYLGDHLKRRRGGWMQPSLMESAVEDCTARLLRIGE
jgi:hypothetical protein